MEWIRWLAEARQGSPENRTLLVITEDLDEGVKVITSQIDINIDRIDNLSRDSPSPRSGTDRLSLLRILIVLPDDMRKLHHKGPWNSIT
jgi:hypothetical protein